MTAFSNPYILLLMIAISCGYFFVEKVKEPVKAAYHKVEKGVKKLEHGIVHVVTVGKK